MSLHIYLNESEFDGDVIKYNDTFFNIYTELTESEITNEILSNIDNAVRTSNLTFSGRTKEMGDLNKNYLSTGTKTLLNIISNPDKCFDSIECGLNALELLLKLKDGNVILRNFGIMFDPQDKCDIICHGKHYESFEALLDDLGK